MQNKKRLWLFRRFIPILVAALATGSALAIEPIEAESLFDSSRLVEIEIELPADNWDKLRKQTRGRGGFAAMFSDPATKPFTYFKGDITIDGRKIPSVGIRKKGFIGSLDEVRPSLKISFGKYIKQQPVAGLDRLTLNNNKQDTALVSQYLSYKVFNAAGVHAPRCNFARVTVNGDYLGIYSNVEAVKAPFLKDRYDDDQGNLYEGTITDFYPRTVDRLEAKTDATKSKAKDAVRLAELLASDDDLPMQEIDELVNVDNFLKYWAVESLLGFWDGYTQNQNNFFVYDNPADGKFYFMPWGADSCFTAGGGPFARFSGGSPTVAVRAEAMLANRLYHVDGIPDRYAATMRSILRDVWNEDELVAAVNKIEELTKGKLHRNQKRSGNSRWGGEPLTMDGVRDFILTRADDVTEELDGDWPVNVADEPRKPMYTISVGTAGGKFATQWSEKSNSKDKGTLEDLELTIEGDKLVLRDVAVKAEPMQSFGFRGRGRGGPSPGTIVVTGIRDSDDMKVTLTMMLDRKVLADGKGKSIPVSGSYSEGDRRGFGRGRPGQMLGGTIHLQQAGTDDGDTIEGKFELSVTEMRGGMMDRMRGRGR